MCATCGCSTDVHEDHAHAHGHHEHGHEHHTHGHDDHAAPHVHAHGEARAHESGTTPQVHALEAAILEKNDRIAARSRRLFVDQGVLTLNFVSSPGAGKTTLLERMIRDLGDKTSIRVIEGDQATSQDADRIRAAGAEALQVNTGSGCHLDAAMIDRALGQLCLRRGELLLIENVGNLVCPALFDLGERAKVLVASVTEGDDKPIKYPHMFRASRLVLLNKVDLLPHLRFDVDRFVGYARQVNPEIEIIAVSALTGEGLDRWYDWLREVHAR